MLAVTFEMIYIILAFAGSAVAGWVDLKTTDIPDKVTFSMIGLGLLLHGLESIYLSSAAPIITCITVTLFLGAFSLVMYYTGLWGGGDGALLTGIGALLAGYQSQLFSFLPFPVIYIVTVIVAGVAYIILYMLALTAKSKTIQNDFSREIKRDYISIAGIILALAFLAYTTTVPTELFLTVTISFLLLSPLLIRFSRSVEKGFYRKIPSSELQVNDMIGEDIPKLGLKKIKLRGLTEEEVKKIKKIKKYIIIREGIRYGPVFFLALLLLFVGGFIFA